MVEETKGATYVLLHIVLSNLHGALAHLQAHLRRGVCHEVHIWSSHVTTHTAGIWGLLLRRVPILLAAIL